MWRESGSAGGGLDTDQWFAQGRDRDRATSAQELGGATLGLGSPPPSRPLSPPLSPALSILSRGSSSLPSPPMSPIRSMPSLAGIQA